MQTSPRRKPNPRALLYNAARALPVYPAIPARVVGLLVVVAVLSPILGASLGGGALWLALLVAAPVTAWWFVREVMPSQTTKGVITRKGDRQQRAGGVASTWDVMERASGKAITRQIPILRPSLVGAPRKDRGPSSVGFLVATNGLGRLPGQRLWVGCRDATMRVGGPGTYKTMSLAVHGLEAPGPLITTSTRFDIARHVHMVRRVKPETVPMRRVITASGVHYVPDWAAGERRTVHVLNLTGEGGIRSTVRWNVLTDCTHYATAVLRAVDMLPDARSAERQSWVEDGRRYLPVLLHAAALAEKNVPDVLRWVELIGRSDPDGSGHAKLRREIADILSSQENTQFEIGLLGAFLAVNDRTRSSITGMMIPALAWIADPAAAEVGAAPLSETTLNIPDLIINRETLHIVMEDSTGTSLSSLTSALVAEIARQAKRLSSYMPAERLDPFLTMLLDECAVTVRLPLDKWTCDMGGDGVALHMSVQSLSQLEQTWGPAGAGTLKGNVGALIMLGGGKDADEMELVSKLCGDRWRRVQTEDTKVLARIAGVQRGEWEKVRVLTPADLMNLEPLQAAVLVRNLGGVFVGRPPIVSDYRWHRQLTVEELRDALALEHSHALEPAAIPIPIPAPTIPLDVRETA